MGKSANKINKLTTASSASKKSVKSQESSSVDQLKPKLQIIVQTIAKLVAIGMVHPLRRDVKSFSGNTKTEAGFLKNLGLLRKQGYMEFGAGKTLILTEKGSRHVGKIDPSSLSNESIQENMKDMLKPKACNIFDALLDGKERNRNAIAKELDYDMSKLSGFQKDLSKMKTLGFVEFPTKQTVKMADKCFPLGLPKV
mmetsp:Transcript_32063/g.35905  ORF Transcript_32063/g.35905 Transcript_32063/m.35905 type:complete len:197 (+) Transcript_32063:459-1049(+)|eukprot:CAMPEP_0170764604 /NCGR_PEP_ID=MMETSP0733-20121128/4110_1 /TAXON_ID=186038 /ORGANISM="Fragilariopsis kerguelensis, Strain L26-C5" /LENGTH=196 /DNA_ID=CAMNT_0011105299 /DNA_START=440 /DNA_END=1030 /DNA_ORIENTATION=-